MPYVKACSLAQLSGEAANGLQIQGHSLAVFKVNGSFYALENRCPHRGGPLAQGDVDDGVVTCPLHAWQFDIQSGKSVQNPNAWVKTYALKVEGEDVYIELP